jgi:TonB family protein
MAVALAIGFLSVEPARAQDSLEAAKDLYANAAYEDALAVLSRLGKGGSRPEIEQYKVFCLIALDRTDEARKAIEAVVSANPMYVPDPAETPPRIRGVFEETRRRLLPDVARRLYGEGKAAFDRKDLGAATAKFEAVVKLIDEASLDGEGLGSELRLLSTGFLDLNKALAAAESPKESAQPERARPEEPPPSAPVSPPVVTRPVAIRQEFPRWDPVDTFSRQAEFVGAVRVRISSTGAVDSAEIVRPVHPAYDRALLAAARVWQYEPARQNGVPVASEHVVEVHLRPRE